MGEKNPNLPTKKRITLQAEIVKSFGLKNTEIKTEKHVKFSI
jgi:hypothetical protein